LRERLLKLAKTNKTQYLDLIQNNQTNNEIEKFLKLEGQYYEDIIPSPQAYEDVKLATIQEQDV
jgi:hypothetical protein